MKTYSGFHSFSLTQTGTQVGIIFLRNTKVLLMKETEDQLAEKRM